MNEGKIVIARLWSRYTGILPLDAPVIGSIDKDKFENICIYLSKSSSLENRFYQKYSMDVFYISKTKSVNMFASVFKLYKILKENKVDILHCYNQQSAFYGFVAAKMAKVPSVIYQTNPFEMIKNKMGLIGANFMKNYSRILVSGRSDRRKVLQSDSKIDPANVMVVDSSIDYQKYADRAVNKDTSRDLMNLPHDALIFGLVGALTDDKQNDVVIEAFTKVKSRINNAHLVFIGDGSQADLLKESAKKSGVGDAIHFAGRRDDVEKCLGALDIFISAKVSYDGIPRTLLEAMASELPCIGPADGGIEALFEDGKCGIAVSKFSPDSLARAMIDLATMSHNRVLDMVNAASLNVKKNYDHKVAAKSLEQIYLNL